MKNTKTKWLFGKITAAKSASYITIGYPFAAPLALTAVWSHPLYLGFFTNLFINISLHLLCCLFAFAIVTFPLSYFKNKWRQNIMMWFLVVPLQLAGPFLFILLFNDQINPFLQPEEPMDLLIILGASSHIYALIIFFIPKNNTRQNGWRHATFLCWPHEDSISTRSINRVYDADFF